MTETNASNSSMLIASVTLIYGESEPGTLKLNRKGAKAKLARNYYSAENFCSDKAGFMY